MSTPNLLGSPTQCFGEQFKPREQLLVSAAVEITLSGKVLNRVFLKSLPTAEFLGAASDPQATMVK